MTRTPGPYIIGQPGGPSGPFYSLVNPQGRVVAMQIPTEADAVALSANPDLLAACEEALESIQWLLPDSAVRDNLTDAISKAKGESA